MFKKNDGRFLIKTPTGYKKFEGVQKKVVDSLYTINFIDGSFIKCSSKHAFLSSCGFKKAHELSIGDDVSGKIISDIYSESGTFIVYDPVGVEEHSTYYSNGVVSHNTEFIGSSATLIPGSKLKALGFRNPVEHTDDGLDIYVKPEPGHVYIATVDCAEGVGQDSSTISVFDVTEMPYRQVAKFKNNQISPLLYPTHIYNVATKYNNAYVLVETNNIGQQVVDILHYDLEYENIFRLEHHNIKGQSISAGFKRSVSFGLKTTKSVKKIGCANLKTLVENDKLIIEDFDTIAELNTFVRVRDSYEAEEGNHDDLVMTLVFFAWLVAQSFFKETTNSDIRQRLMEEHNLNLEEEIAPVGVFDDGRQEEKYHDGDDLWTVQDRGGYPMSTF